MKKILIIFLSLALCFLASCDLFGGESSEPEQSRTASGSTRDDDVSEPSFPVSSVSDGVSEEISEEISEESSEEISEEISEDEPDISYEYSGDVPVVGWEYDKLPVDRFDDSLKKNYSSYRIAFTKNSPVDAVSCITNQNIGITGFFDGKWTRYSDSVTGEYLTCITGEYLFPLCDSFASGNLFSGFKSNKNAIKFTRDESGKISFTREDVEATDFESSLYVYSKADEKVFCLTENCVYAVEGEKVFDCVVTADSLLENINAERCVSASFIENLPKEHALAKNGALIKGGFKNIVRSADSLAFACYDESGVYYFTADGKLLHDTPYTCGGAIYGNRAWVFKGSQGYVLEFK